jgi:hypothetical protein
MNSLRSQQVASLALSALLLVFLSGCGSANTSEINAPTVDLQNPPTGPNVLSISVNGGPTVAAGDGVYTNGAFASVTVCVPGSTTNCQTIGGILVDTGSPGLRILSSALTLTLPQQNDSSGNPIGECADFASGVAWGPVQTADVTVSGETASSLPIQVIGAASPVEPGACAGENFSINSLDTLGANGILGIGAAPNDCGSACAAAVTASTPPIYYSCPQGSNCNLVPEAVASQVTNPIVMFTTDNNGSIVELPAIGAATVDGVANGVVVFGIGTESNNGLGSATVLGIDPNTNNITTVFDNTEFTDSAFFDLGTNLLVFNPLSSSLAGTEVCEDGQFDIDDYCPNANVALTAENVGVTNANSAPANFTIGDADELFDENANAAVINGVGAATSSLVFDWGLPFFYGTNVYTGIAGQTVSGATTPFFAY